MIGQTGSAEELEAAWRKTHGDAAPAVVRAAACEAAANLQNFKEGRAMWYLGPPAYRGRFETEESAS